ncbi:uncharacterized protein LOC135845308 isoform X2 [Planococcus citri]
MNTDFEAATDYIFDKMKKVSCNDPLRNLGWCTMFFFRFHGFAIAIERSDALKVAKTQPQPDGFYPVAKSVYKDCFQSDGKKCVFTIAFKRQDYKVNVELVGDEEIFLFIKHNSTHSRFSSKPMLRNRFSVVNTEETKHHVRWIVEKYSQLFKLPITRSAEDQAPKPTESNSI